MLECAGCHHIVADRQCLKCSLCAKHYDLPCANVSEEQFYHSLIDDRSWKCQECRNKMPKVNNVNDVLTNSDDANVTLRRKPNIDQRPQFCNGENDLSVDEIEGNTFANTTYECNLSLTHNIVDNKPITLNQFSTLLDSKLEKIKNSIILDIKNTIQDTIQSEIKSAIKKVQEDVEQRSHILTKSQETLKKQIVTIDTTIGKIEEQLNNLVSTKKIVLYGLTEDHHETENNLYDRVSQAFQEIMNININPYMEEIKRIGKQGHKRPLEIELISKRMTKYILENARAFKDTGLAVGIYMDGKKLQERNDLRKHLTSARKNGDHAVIRNNRLLINGIEFKSQCITTQVTSTKKIEDLSVMNKTNEVPTATVNNLQQPAATSKTSRSVQLPKQMEGKNTFRQ